MFIDFRERGRGVGREREREASMWERNIDQLPSIPSLIEDQTHNVGMFSDRRSNPQPFWCTGRCSNQLGHLDRARNIFFTLLNLPEKFMIIQFQQVGEN